MRAAMLTAMILLGMSAPAQFHRSFPDHQQCGQVTQRVEVTWAKDGRWDITTTVTNTGSVSLGLTVQQRVVAAPTPSVALLGINIGAFDEHDIVVGGGRSVTVTDKFDPASYPAGRYYARSQLVTANCEPVEVAFEIQKGR